MDQKIREEVFQDCAEDLCRGRRLSRDQWRILLEGRTRERAEKMAEKASALRDRIYGKRIFIRGLIEFTNYCRNDCYYCGIRKSNPNAERYRLTKEDILRFETDQMHSYINEGNERVCFLCVFVDQH